MQDDLPKAFSASTSSSPTFAPPNFSPSPVNRTRVYDGDEGGWADAPIGPVDINAAAPVGQPALDEVGVAAFDKDRVIRPLPTSRFKRVAAVTIPGLKDVAAAAAPGTLDENREMDLFASTS